MLDDKQKIHLCGLIFRTLEGIVQESDFLALDTLLRQDKDAARYYAEYISMNADLYRPGQFGTGLFPKGGSPDAMQQWMWDELAIFEKTAEPVEINASVQETALITGVGEIKKTMKIGRPVSRPGLWILVSCLAALFIIMAYVISHPYKPPQVVAHITDQVGVQWAYTENSALRGKDILNVRESLYLKDGFIKLALADGAEVIIQAPAEFRVEQSNQMYLIWGKLSSKVPLLARGFVVRTPKATVVDYGTEFGVLVDSTGQTEAHVFKGMVELRCGQNPILHGAMERLTAGLAGKVSSQETLIEGVYNVSERLFVRDIEPIKQGLGSDRRLSLADIVGGGNGLGFGVLGSGINPVSGEYVTNISCRAMAGSGHYTKITKIENPSIDGVFVPDGENGPVQVSSSGLMYDGIADTTGSCWHEISNGLSPGRNIAIGDLNTQQLSLNGIAYGNRAKPALYVHANVGITFDLNKIRQTLFARTIKAFTATCGIPDQLETDEFSKVDFIVLVDGRCRFRQDQMGPDMRVSPVHVPIWDEDRFLTLITTDGGNGNFLDWAIFAEPFLELEDQQ